MFWIFLVVTLPLTLIVGIPFYLTAKERRKDETDVLHFVKHHPEKCSLYLIENDKTTIDYQSGERIPLASTVKIIVAIEFSKQVADKRIDPKQMIRLSELDLAPTAAHMKAG